MDPQSQFPRGAARPIESPPPPPPPPPYAMAPGQPYGPPPAPPPPPASRGGIPPVAIAGVAGGLLVLIGLGALYAFGFIGSAPPPTHVIGACPPDCRPVPSPSPVIPTGHLGGGGATPTPGVSGNSSELAGNWLGTIDMGACGNGSDLMYFGSDGGWAMNLKMPFVGAPNNQTQCADVSLTGRYATQGGTIDVQIDPPPNCELYGTCHLEGTLSYQFNTAAAVELCDIGAASGRMGFWGGTCNMFYRQ